MKTPRFGNILHKLINMDVAWPTLAEFSNDLGTNTSFQQPQTTRPLALLRSPAQLPRAWKRSNPSIKSNRPSQNPTARILAFNSSGRARPSINPLPKPPSPPRASPSAVVVSAAPRPTSSFPFFTVDLRFLFGHGNSNSGFLWLLFFLKKKRKFHGIFLVRIAQLLGGLRRWQVFVGFAGVFEPAAGGLPEFQACHCWRWRHR